MYMVKVIFNFIIIVFFNIHLIFLQNRSKGSIMMSVYFLNLGSFRGH